MHRLSQEQIEKRKHLHIELPKQKDLFSKSYQQTSRRDKLQTIFTPHIRQKQIEAENEFILSQITESQEQTSRTKNPIKPQETYLLSSIQEIPLENEKCQIPHTKDLNKE